MGEVERSEGSEVNRRKSHSPIYKQNLSFTSKTPKRKINYKPFTRNTYGDFSPFLERFLVFRA